MHRQPLPAPADAAPRRFTVLGRQLPFATVFGALIALLVLWRPEGHALADAVLIGAGIAFVASVLAAVLPWQSLPRWAEAAVPLLDMAAVTALLTVGTRASALIVLPALWLARMGRAGTVTAIVAGVAASMGVDVIDAVRTGNFVLSPANGVRIFIVPSVIVAVSVSLHLSERRAAARSALLAGQSALVEELLEETSLDRARLEGVLNTIDAGVAVVDPSGEVAVVNRALRVATDGRVTVGTPVTELARSLYAADGVTSLTDERLREIAAGQVVERRVVWWERSLEDRTAFRVSAAPLPSRDGQGDGAVVALHDITDELRAIAEREDFVSSVSHELRTPLTSVTGYLDLALDDPELPEHIRTYLEVADRNAGRLRILIDNLLAAARTGADRASRELVALRDVVADVVESQTPRAEDRDISIVVTADGDGVVVGDVGRLTQVVDNIVSNAVKYSHTGGHVDIALAGPDGVPGQRVRLTVTDDGPGIATDAQAQLFSRFYRAPAVRNTPVQGTGLGLHISRQIVEALGGSIALRSTPGRGTSVEILLPAGERR